MKYFLALTLVCFIGLNMALAQQGGAQTLRLAQSIYEQGRLHELPSLPGLQDAEIVKYSKSDQVSAYKLLTLAHIYLEEPEKADETMLKLLRADHFFEPNEQVDPAEFLGLYKTFRTKQVFNIGLKFGINNTTPMLSDLYYVVDGSQGKGKYSTPLSLQFGIVFEKALFSGSKNKTLNRLTFAPEVLYTSRAFGYTNSSFSSQLSAADFKGTIKQSWLDINLLVQYKINKSKTLQTYVMLGPGASYILKGTIGTPTRTWDGGSVKGAGSVNGADIDNTTSYKKIVPSIVAAAGLKFKFGAIYLLAEGRIQYGLTSPVNSATRTNVQSVFDYSYTLPDYKPLTVMGNIGFVFPYFNPIKLKRK
jgi:hypothetical protein